MKYFRSNLDISASSAIDLTEVVNISNDCKLTYYHFHLL